MLCDDLLTGCRVTLMTIDLALCCVELPPGRAQSPPRNPGAVEFMIGKGDNVLDRHGHRLAHHDPGKRLPTAQHPMLSLNILSDRSRRAVLTGLELVVAPAEVVGALLLCGRVQHACCEARARKNA